MPPFEFEEDEHYFEPSWPEEVEPRCDICGAMQVETPAFSWNGDTGNHHVCERLERDRARAPQFRYTNPISGEVYPPQEVPQDMPLIEPDNERIRCHYVERTCLRRDNDGNVPIRDENGRRTTERCSDCGLTYCTQHRHTAQRRAENYCDAHGIFHPRCMLTEVCEDCGGRFCEEQRHEGGSGICVEFSGREHDEIEYDRNPNGDSGYYPGPWREAELLFEGDTPVPGLATGKRYISFELEEEIRPGGTGRFTLPRKFGITSDGSLRNGVEVTFPPSRMDALAENARIAVDAMRRGGYAPTSRCGMHTHIDMRDKVNDSKFLSHLFATFFAVEDVLFAMQDPNRVGNSYCQPLRRGWKFYDAYGVNAEDFDFVFYKQPKTLANKLRLEEMKKSKGGNRYNAFNFMSVWYRGSLEVRLHEGCLNTRRMLLWAELLQHIIQRVEDGITYPTLRKLLDMPVSPEKLTLFGRVFRLPDNLMRYVQERITEAQGAIRFRMPYTANLGIPKKGKSKSLLPAREFKATHRRCRWCSALIAGERRCSYCRRAPRYTRDEHGLHDERVMLLRGGRDENGRPARTAMTEAEFQRISGQVATFATAQ